MDDNTYDDGVHPYPVKKPADPAAVRRRRLASQIANAERWAHEEDRYAATAAARAGFERKFEDQVDPDRVLAPEERARRAASARRAHFLRLAQKSAEARRKKKLRGE